ncbi:MAG: extensin family protein [Pseudomonadota bacterium]|nr:extensin family protein [Pseudomonadota bacterium]MEC9086178.1 extensin family protein [Pseudomonadota bacterium]
MKVARRHFGNALGPDYNLAHANHFHFDASRFNLCL